MLIKNGSVYIDGSFVKKDLMVDDSHKIADICEPGTVSDENCIDATGKYVIPGLVDVHIHGAVGHDFSDGDSLGLAQIAKYLKSKGITSFCPTSMTLPKEDLLHTFRSILEVPQDSDHANIAGIHMEGPYISPSKKGAQKEEYIVAPDIESFQELNKACNNNIRIVTIAPEMPGSMEFIQAMHDSVSISLGHSSAEYSLASAAYQAGANHATHLFNAMPPLHHRDPGIIGAAADQSHVMVELICDGIHINPSVIRMVFRIFGEDRVVLISDAMRATGMEDGVYELGGQDVIKKGNRATLADGTLAGSATNLFDCMKNVVSYGIPLETAIKAATLNPSNSIGDQTIGRIKTGLQADLLILDNELNLVQVI